MTWVRLNLVVEGWTEKAFVDSVLKSHLNGCRIEVNATVISTGRSRRGHFCGGAVGYDRLKSHLNRLLGDEGAWCSTMIDYYKLPDIPGYSPKLASVDPGREVKMAEEALKVAINCSRFIPYFQLHEFEALLLSDIDVFKGEFPRFRSKLDNFKADCQRYESPELIDGGSETHPSERLRQLKIGYSKVVHGPVIAAGIGLEKIRARCPHFSDWLTQLEALQVMTPRPPIELADTPTDNVNSSSKRAL